MRILLLSSVVLLSALPTAAYAAGSEAAEPFVASRDREARTRSLECLTQAIYYEARSESEDGQRAVAQVVLNRVRHPSYPNSVCGVVFQGSHRSTGCQFSFTCMGMIGPIGDPRSWDRARRIAAQALSGSVYRPVGLATHYHTTAIRPYWAPSLVRQIVLGAHIFYRTPGSGTVEAFSQAPAEWEPEAGARATYAVARTEMLQVEQPRRERFTSVRERFAPTRQRYAATEVREIPVPERRLVYRTFGPRQGAIAASAPISAARVQAPRTIAPRRGPRVRMEGGIRVIRGGGRGDTY
ncbi:MAG TPA: cell wall hydrolase [Allosphingosinicella sp.]|nr:cell wall hydrolase [Allosphingosinicella sp.]